MTARLSLTAGTGGCASRFARVRAYGKVSDQGMSRKRLRIVHVINSFEFGGAETMLRNFLLRSDRDRFDSSVACLIDNMTLAQPLRDAGFPVIAMGMKAGIPDPRGMWRLIKHLRAHRPDVVQTWMDHSNLIGGIAAKSAGVPVIVWGVHHSHHVRGIAKPTTLLTVSACATLSHTLPAAVVCCSEHSRKMYTREGFAPNKLTFIPNGFDTDVFKPDADARTAIRDELRLAPEVKLIGLAARYDPFKDHSTFLRAAAILRQRIPEAHFVLCGSRIDSSNAELVREIASLGLTSRCHLLGARRDVAKVHAALDVEASSSISEAFPLVLGEAMASGVPCVATNVGDSALIIGPTGRIVPPRDPQSLANALADMLSLEPDARRQLSEQARDRICERFELGVVTRQYERLYESLCNVTPSKGKRPLPTRTRNDDRKRVMMIVESSAGGTGRHVLDLADGLIRRGYECDVIHSTRRIDQLFVERMSRIHGLHTLALPMHTTIHPSDIALLRDIRAYARRRGPFDIIHGHSSKGGALARLAALGTGAAAFYTLHGLIMMDPGLALAKRGFYLAIELLLARRTAGIIAVSPEEQRAALRLKFGDSRVAMIPNGIDDLELTDRAAARSEMNVSDDKIVAGFVGRLVDQKAPHVLIEAFARAVQTVPHLRLALVGAGPLERSLRQLAHGLRVNEHVIWLGERDARSVLAGFDLFAMSSRKEGLPYVILEAMNVGLPIVATDSSGVEILVKSGVNGEVVPRDDVSAFADALARVAADPQRILSYGAASKARASELTIDNMVESTIALYQRAFQQTRPSAEQVVNDASDDADDLFMEAQVS